MSPKDEGQLGQTIIVRVTDADVERLDALAERYPALGKRSNAARAALRVGMSAIEEDPGIVMTASAPSAPKRKK